MNGRCWTVTAKRKINDKIPQGFTVMNLFTQSTDSHNYAALQKRVKEMTGVTSGGFYHDGNWEWK